MGNFKVKCIFDGDSDLFLKDEIYEVKDGLLYCETSLPYSYDRRYNSLLVLNNDMNTLKRNAYFKAA